jgi:hypothetical protein
MALRKRVTGVENWVMVVGALMNTGTRLVLDEEGINVVDMERSVMDAVVLEDEVLDVVGTEGKAVSWPWQRRLWGMRIGRRLRRRRI